MSRPDPVTSAEDEKPGVDAHDNSLGRLLTLTDGVFAIAMTLLALDLRVPELGHNPADHALRHALGDLWRNYLSFTISFYVVGNYWQIHRRQMRSLTATHPQLVRHTLTFLLLIAALPFPAALLGRYGDVPSALALYGIFNVVVGLLLLRLRWDVRRHGLRGDDLNAADRDADAGLVGDLVVFALCIPGAYVFAGNGPWILLALFVSGRVGGPVRRRLERRRRTNRRAQPL